MEKTDEWQGAGMSYDFAFRTYDPRLGRFLSRDPLSPEFPWNSPYAFAENDVLRFIDLEGLETPSQPSTVRPDGGMTTAVDATNTAGVGGYVEIQKNASHSIPVRKQTMQAGGVEGSPQYKQFKYNVELYGPWVIPGYDIGVKLLKGEEITWLDLGVEVAGFIPFGKVVSKSFKAVAKSEFSEAAMKELGNFLKGNADQTAEVMAKRLFDSAKTHEKRITQHKEWIANPKLKYGDAWDTFTQEHKDNIIYHWKQDIKRHEAYRDSKKAAAIQLLEEGIE